MFFGIRRVSQRTESLEKLTLQSLFKDAEASSTENVFDDARPTASPLLWKSPLTAAAVVTVVRL